MMKKTYNILFISHERKLGGASRSLVALAEQLQGRGHKVYVAVLLKNCPLAMELRKKNISTIPIFFGWWMYPLYWNKMLKICFRMLYRMEYVAVKYLARKVHKYQIDIIHSNSSAIDIGARVARITGRKHVWHFREFGKEDFQLEYLNGKEKSVQFIEHNSDGIIFVSQKVREAYSNLQCSEKIKIIYNGIAKDYLWKRDGNLQNKKVVFLVSGTIIQNKNQMLVVKAAESLIEQGYVNFELQIAGASTSLKDSRLYEQRMREYIRSHLLQNQIMILGYISDMWEIRKKADVEIVASRSEAFGRVSVEAMMSSMPVIASDAGANPEIVVHEETGLLFRCDDVEQLADAMKFFIVQPTEITRMGKNAYKRAKERFTSERNAEEIEAFYGEIMRR